MTDTQAVAIPNNKQAVIPYIINKCISPCHNDFKSSSQSINTTANGITPPTAMLQNNNNNYKYIHLKTHRQIIPKRLF